MIDTGRLKLRKWIESDLEPFAAINTCKHVCEFLPEPLSRDESDIYAEKIHDHFEEKGYGLYAVEIKNTGEFIGFTGLSVPGFDAHFMPTVEVGWRLSYNHWGNGYATEAARTILSYGFDHLGLKEIVSFTVPDNIRSRRVMEKIGMQHNPEDDFNHPKLPDGHPLQKHVLYRIKKMRIMSQRGVAS